MACATGCHIHVYRGKTDEGIFNLLWERIQGKLFEIHSVQSGFSKISKT